MKKGSIEWLKSAEMDLENIRFILQVEGLTPVVAFHAQQAVEKCFKSLLEEFAGKVPKEHSVIKLHKMVAEFIRLDVDDDILTDFDELYIESRYPGELGLLQNGKPTLRRRKVFLYNS
jgi:HEPN domain-containing protein